MGVGQGEFALGFDEELVNAASTFAIEDLDDDGWLDLVICSRGINVHLGAGRKPGEGDGG